MDSRLRQKLAERREKAALAGIEAGLGDLRPGGALEPGAVPAWVGEAIERTWDIFTEPAERLRDDTPPERLDAWLEDLLTTQGLTGRVHLASHLGILPWLECRAPGRADLARVRGAIEEPWMFLSSSLDTLVVTEGEYHYEAHVLRGGS
ncbi:hypothetical protein AB0N50_04855 [Streptomyces pharetrae]|uniref:hypothetical protein n=1 Tax=Streptomyces pharetrae TaxID=291370 RepID=UPI0034604FCB